MPRVPNTRGHSATSRRAVGLIPRAGWRAQGLASPGHWAAQRVGVREAVARDGVVLHDQLRAQVAVVGDALGGMAAVQQLACLAVDLQLGGAVGVVHLNASAQAVIDVSRLARGAGHAVANVEIERLRPAHVQVAIEVVAQRHVDAAGHARHAVG